MIEVRITPEMIEIANQRTAKLPKVIKNSIMSGERNFEGCLGEVVVASYLNAQYITTYDFDLVHQGSSLEVKTKVRTVKPKPYYEVSVAAYNTKQDCDYYVFVSLLSSGGKYPFGYILGFYQKFDYINNSKFLKKGELDPSNNYTVRADCFNLPISNLISPVCLK